MRLINQFVRLAVLTFIVAGCTPTKPTAEQKARLAASLKPLPDQRSEALVNCLSFYSAYAPHIQPSNPQDAAQYYSFAHSNSITAFILIAEGGGKAFDYKDIVPAAQAFTLREALWGEYLKTAAPQEVSERIQLCKQFSPAILELTTKMRQDPKLLPLYRGMDNKLQQRLSGKTR